MKTEPNSIILFGVSLFTCLLIFRYYRNKSLPLPQRYLTFGPRFWTGWVDSFVLWPLTAITNAILLLNVPGLVAALILFVQSMAWLIYTVVMHGRYGQTIGKMVTKVRVVDFRTEGPITFRQAWLREGIPVLLNLGFLGYEIFGILTGKFTARAILQDPKFFTSSAFWLVNSLPLVWFLAEIVTMFTNPRRRALHDYIAGTVVVRTNAEEAAPQIVPVAVTA